MDRDSRSFVGSLFDFSFSSFVTTKLIKLIYSLAMLFNAIFALGIVTAGFGQGFFTGILALFIFAPLVFLLFTMLARVWMELVIVLFRTAEYMKTTADNTGRMA